MKNVSRLAQLLAVFVFLGGCAVLTPLPEPATLDDRLKTLAALPPAPFSLPATIHWNEYGVPFVEAQTDRDAAMALGLVHAHLRLGQMEFLKRVSMGRLSEMAGPVATDVDAAIRTFDLRRAVPEIVATMPEATRQWLEAFAAGVNHYKRHMPERPHAMTVLAMKDEPWTVEDTVGIGRLGATDLNWLALTRLLPKRGTAQWPELWAQAARHQGELTPSFRTPERVETARSEPSSVRTAELLSDLLSATGRHGSNTFVVSGDRSESGAPILANDPHLGFVIPNLWLLAGVKSPSYHCVGMMLVGTPVAALGRNAHVSWGGTNMRQYASDIVEVTGESLEASTRRIERRVWWDADVVIRESSVGPVVSDLDLLPFPEGRDFALRWMGHRPSDETTAFLDVMRAKGWRDVQAAMDDYGVPGLNLLFADRDGTIGQLSAARLPARSPAFPKDLWITREQSDADWRTILGARDLPMRINPPDGVLASANNRPTDNPPTRMGWNFPREDRIERIYEMLAGRERWDVAGLQFIQRDTYSPSHHRLNQAMAERLRAPGASDAAAALTSELAAWDGRFDTDSRGAYLHMALLSRFAPRFYERIGRPGAETFWWRTTFLPVQLMRDMDEADPTLTAQALADSLATMDDEAPQAVVWGDVHRIRVAHVMGRVPVLGGRYRFADLPMPGGTETVFKSAHDLTAERHFTAFGSQSRHISDMADPDENHFVLFGGQDGRINSANFRDQTDLWAEGRLVRLPLTLERVRQDFPLRTTFAPSGEKRRP